VQFLALEAAIVVEGPNKWGVHMVVRRTQGMRDQGIVHPTRIKIIAAATELMKKKGVAEFHIDDLLAATELTRGAVYHHFENVGDVIEGTLLAIYTEGVEENIKQVRQVLATAKTFDEFRNGVIISNRYFIENRHLRLVRKLRAHAMATTATSPELSIAIALKQNEITSEYISVIVEAQARGWVRPDLDSASLAVFIQAYSFGIIVDDISQTQVDIDSLARIIESFYENCVYAPQ
jgi:AcrR family transcriptional regulator